MQDLDSLQQRLGVTFDNQNLLGSAITHTSFVNKGGDDCLFDHYQRLEFLGDSVLSMVVNEHLYHTFLQREGELSRLHQSLVNNKMLFGIALSLGLKDYVQIGENRLWSDTGATLNILADVLEAIIGAIYLDQGYEVVKKFISDNIIIKLPFIIEQKLFVNAKYKLDEMCGLLFHLIPAYTLLRSHQDENLWFYIVGVHFQGSRSILGEGTGRSIKDAEFAAAEQALEFFGWVKETQTIQE